MKRCILFLFIFLGIANIAIAQVQPTDTDDDGYINISTLDHLRWISENPSSWDKNFELDNDIDAAATVSWNNNAGFSPIGDDTTFFTGNFEGHGFAIDNLNINRPKDKYVGLLGFVLGSEISNIRITNCKVNGSSYVGALMGKNGHSIVKNCYSSGTISGSGYIGGLVGESYDIATISCSYSNCNVAGIGKYCMNVGGLVGGNSSVIRNSYSTGNVSGAIYVGGLIGRNEYYSSVGNCYSSGIVSGLDSVGGLIGDNYSDDVRNSFWDLQTSSQTTSDGGIGKTTSEMKTLSTFTDAGWNFQLVWSIDATVNNGYPYLNDRGLPDFPGIEPIDTDGDGYRNISCYSHLHWVSQHSSSWGWNYELDNNINADTTRMLSGDIGFTPIGTEFIKFTGKFEGSGYDIDGLYINKLGNDYVGLFSCVRGSTISNVGITNCQLMGHDYVGSILGFSCDSTLVSNCYSKGSVVGNDFVGGIVGSNGNTILTECYYSGNVIGRDFIGGIIGWEEGYSILRNCYSMGNVSGRDYVGGLVGFNEVNTLENCYSSSKVSGASFVGGLVGSDDAYSILRNCYSMGNVSGVSSVGGLVGCNASHVLVSSCYSTGDVFGRDSVGGLIGLNYYNSYVSNCYSTGRVSGDSLVGGLVGLNTNNSLVSNSFSTGITSGKYSVGGLVGLNALQSIVINSFWDTQTSGLDSSAGGMSKTTAEMKTQTTFTDSGWNFQLVWSIDATVNNGYPYLNDRGLNYSGIEPIDTDGDGYRNISCYSHLHWISNHSSSWAWNFELDNNINADSTSLLFGDYGFTPIGNRTYGFEGNFEGNGFTIDHLYINRPGYSEIGLFGITINSNISNIGVTNCRIIGGQNVGSLVGYNAADKVSKSYSTGSISGSEKIGGLVGRNASTIINSYSTCNITGNKIIGGLVGLNSGNSNVINSYSVGKVMGKDTTGGLIGKNVYPATVEIKSFWDIETSGQSSSAGGTGKTTTQMKTHSTFLNAGWDFDSTWAIDPIINNGYPHINISAFTIIGFEPIDTDGDGYRNISCYSHLHWISKHSSSWSWDYELDNDIDADTTRLLAGNVGFTPIGTEFINFKGKFEGNGFTIDGLYINKRSEYYIGLFGMTLSSTISNVGITNCHFVGNLFVGGLVGYADYSTIISNCYSTGKVSGSVYIGGLVGKSDRLTLNNCYSSVDVTGSESHVGGLVGYADYSTISNCYSTGIVSGNSAVGGFVGSNSENSKISNSYSTGIVSGNSTVGGFVGSNSENSKISNSYSTGSVTGNNYIGGLVGVNSKSTVSNCFWDTQTSGKTTSAGGTGKTTAEMKNKSTFTSAGWDFDSTWAITGNYNDGYPNLVKKTGSNSIEEIYSHSLIYPQPATNELFVRLSETSNESAKIKLYDQSWLLALATETNANDGQIRLNISTLASGFYHVLININGKNYSAKVVVAR